MTTGTRDNITSPGNDDLQIDDNIESFKLIKNFSDNFSICETIECLSNNKSILLNHFDYSIILLLIFFNLFSEKNYRNINNYRKK